MIWNLYQQFKIEKIQRELNQVSVDTRSIQTSTGNQVDRYDHLCLAMEALWSLLKEHHGLENLDLLQRMYEVDLEDGFLDGKTSGRIVTCLGCGQKINTRIKKCIHCGMDNVNYSPFAG